ncbi:hypothetical protein B1813_00735 [Saccharomonospora piscinae]|uniref:Low-complexity protein n=1 Tax=Saccharomonospora piscinae TaxID=687388 RepID=A0A1V9ACA0_SACPI|nr:pentapeptide repeat-containing protein [Saccharomonospora piscinae]OQO94666.1 hypothetical protein B1813_00735 [Saccharomonospora piscinae]
MTWRWGHRKGAGDESVTEDGVALRPLPASSVWWVLGGLLGVAAVVTAVLLLVFGDGTESDKVRLEAIRLAGTIVLGTGGGAALFVALRRQRTTELDLVHKLAEARTTQHDAEQRRVTELYTAAVEQLGHDRAAVRLGALYALQRLGQDHPEQRRPIVNVWCAYLRMSFRDPATDGLDEQESLEWRQEREVRVTLQRLLREHVHSGPYREKPASPRFWGDELDIDLTGATLHELDLDACRIHPRTTFTHATFAGNSRFRSATFAGDAWFAEATFTGHVWFNGTVFTRSAWFGEATFTSEASFAQATVSGASSFIKATFSGSAYFDDTTFIDTAVFEEAVFTGVAWFRNATFTKVATFAMATFTGPVLFRDTTFDNGIALHSARARCDHKHQWPAGWSCELVSAAREGMPEGEDPDMSWGRLQPVPARNSRSCPEPRSN